MLRSVAGVIAGYLAFGLAAAAFFSFSGRNPHGPVTLAFAIGSTAYGMFFSALGGYLAASIAGRRPVTHGVVVTLLIGLGAAISLYVQPAGDTTWSQVATLLFMAPVATLGAYFQRRLAKSLPAPS